MAPRSTVLPSAQTESARELRRAFHCDLCNKGYARITELEAHENSYDHQHRKRMKDLKQITRNPTAAVRASRNDKKRNENSEMISLNVEKSKDGGGRRGFRDIGGERETEKEKVEDVVMKDVPAMKEVRRPIAWDDLPQLTTLIDPSTLPPQWQQKQIPTNTQVHLSTFTDAEKRKAHFEDDEELLEEMGIADDDWIADEEAPSSDVDIDQDWADYMQSDEWKRQKNEDERKRKEMLALAWNQRRAVQQQQ